MGSGALVGRDRVDAHLLGAEEAEGQRVFTAARRFTAAIGRFARQYAEQNERDHAQLLSAITAGAVESLPG